MKKEYLDMYLLPDPFLNGSEDPHWCYLCGNLAVIATQSKQGTEVRIKAMRGQLALRNPKKPNAPYTFQEGYLALKRLSIKEYESLCRQRRYSTRKSIMVIQKELIQILCGM